MNPKFFSSILLLFVITFSWGQSTLSFGPELKSRKSYVKTILGEENSGYLFIESLIGRNVVSIGRVSKDLATVTVKRVPFKVEGGISNYHSAHLIGNTFYLFTIVYDWKAKRQSIYGQAIDTKNLTLTGNRKLLAQGSRSAEEVYVFIISPSPDRSKFALIEQRGTYDTEKQQFQVKVFDSELQELTEQDTRVSEADHYLQGSTCGISNEGHFYVYNREYHQLVVLRNGKIREEYNFEFDEPISGLKASFTENGDILCAGFYQSEKNQGVFFCMFDKSSKRVIKSNTENLPYQRFILGREDWDYSFHSYRTDELYMHSDGSITLIGEFFLRQPGVTTDGHVDAGNFEYNEIIVSKISETGEIEWSTMLPKHQRDGWFGGYYSSYTPIFQDGKLHLFFNDNIENLSRTDGKVVKMDKEDGMGLMEAIVSAEGKVSKEMIYHSGNKNYKAIPTLFHLNTPTELIICSQKKQKTRFASIKVN